MKKGTIIAIVVVVLLVIWGFSGYNRIITLNENADAQWANVESSYQRRFDLIPNLVSAVKANLNQEQTVYGDIAEARTRYSGATTPNDKAAAASQVESALGRLLVIVENYPQLGSNTTIQGFMSQLEGSENRITVERNRFNDIVKEYNTAVQRFPTNILAGIMGYHQRAYFEAAPGTAAAPTVNF